MEAEVEARPYGMELGSVTLKINNQHTQVPLLSPLRVGMPLDIARLGRAVFDRSRGRHIPTVTKEVLAEAIRLDVGFEGIHADRLWTSQVSGPDECGWQQGLGMRVAT